MRKEDWIYIKDKSNDIRYTNSLNQQGKLEGIISFYGELGNLFSMAEFKNGLRIGTITLFDKSGKPFEV